MIQSSFSINSIRLGPVHLQNAPGPGAYEQRSSLGKSKMFTARGSEAKELPRGCEFDGRIHPKIGLDFEVMSGVSVVSPNDLADCRHFLLT